MVEEKSPTTDVDVKNLAREIHVVKGTQIQLAQAVQSNTQAFSDALQMADCHIHVLQKAFDDLVQGKVQKTESGSVDFAQYMTDYWAVMGFAGFVEGLKNFAPQEESLISAPNDDTIVFGGS